MTIRVRLTVLYGGLFFLAGAVLLAITYVLVWQGLNSRLRADANLAGYRLGVNSTNGVIEMANGTRIKVSDIAELIREREEATRDAVLGNLLTQGAIALAGVGLVAVAFGWLLARRALQPVHRITETAGRIARADGRGLHERIPSGGPRDEVTELARTFNAMLERLDRSFDGQRRFVANASHELRTPLAVQRALIEITTTRAGTSEDARQLGDGLLDLNIRHEKLIDGLLTLADSQNELTVCTPVDLADVAARALDVAGTQPDIRVEEPELAAAPVFGDPVLLERMAHNLVENAVRHNESGGWLRVSTFARDGASVLAVTNSGPVIRAYEVPTMFEPFRRLDRERVDGDRGFGLGLSIVRAIVHAHDGEITVVPRAEGGLTCVVYFGNVSHS